MELVSPVSFEPVGSVTNVFFDDRNQQVFSVRSGGATGIIVRGFSEEHISTFISSSDLGPIFTIKLSPDQSVLAIQRAKNQVEFFKVLSRGLSGSIDEAHKFIQVSKGKTPTILGFFWTKEAEILFITEAGLEIHSIANPERGIIKNLRNSSLCVNWFTYSPGASFLICSSSSSTGTLQPFIIRNSHIIKIPRVEVDQKEILLKEKDVFIMEAFGKTYVGLFLPSSIHLYSLSPKDTLNKSHVLRLGRVGPFSTNVVDNILLIHHQPSGSSLLFDPSLPGESDGTLIHMEPITSARLSGQGSGQTYPCHWAAFQPDLIVDGKEGKCWRLRCVLRPSILQGIPSLKKKIEFLLRREGSKRILLDLLLEKCRETPRLDLSGLGEAFDLLHAEYVRHLKRNANANKGGTQSVKVILDQSDLFTNVFSVLLLGDEETRLTLRQKNFILMEYFRSLKEHDIPVMHFLDELLINLLVQEGAWFQLHQCLQYHIFTDSKPLSCLLLSLESAYPPAGQLALDMLKRLGTANSEIVEILLSKNIVLSALKFAESDGGVIQPRRFLEAALASQEPSLFYSTYKFFEKRNLLLRGSKGFTSSDNCEIYVQKFQELYPVA